jgi:hypothetical protein
VNTIVSPRRIAKSKRGVGKAAYSEKAATRRVIWFSSVSLSHCNIVVFHSPIWNFFSAALPGSVLLFSFLHRVPVRGALRFCRHVPEFSFLLISGLIVFQYTIKQVHGLKTEYYLGVGDFIVAPRSFEFRDFFLSETLSMS